MSLYQTFHPSMLHFNNVNPFQMDNTPDNYSFPSPDIPSSMDYLESIFSDDFPLHVDHFFAGSSTPDFQMNLDEFDRIFADGMPQILDEFEEIEQSDGFHDHDHGMGVDVASMDMMEPLVLPFDGMEVDSDLCLLHLVQAYGEAIDNRETELSEAVAQRVVGKVGPLGGTTERLLYYMFQRQNRESEYLMEESIKNFYVGFRAFYQMFPYGKFAHFVANAAILEALPSDVEIVHLIDFDIGEGLQWASFMEAVRDQRKEIRVTSVRFDEDDETSPFRWRFEETKRRLFDHAKSCGLKIKMEEVRLVDLECTMMKIKKGDCRRKSWHVFNSHVGLPHMGRGRSRKDVLEFLRLAKHFLHHTSKGIITYGDGDGDASHNTTMNPTLSYSSFLDGKFAHYRALLESMESNFPHHLGEARLALESIFVGPNVCTVEWRRRWEERRECGEVELGGCLEGMAMSEASLVEAKEVVKEGISLYGVRIEGEKRNEMVMEWNGVPMVRVCCWKSCGKYGNKNIF